MVKKKYAAISEAEADAWKNQFPAQYLPKESFERYEPQSAEGSWGYAELIKLSDGIIEQGVVRGYNSRNEQIWQYFTEEYPVAQMEKVTELGRFGEQYYLNENGVVTVLNLENGEVLWKTDFRVGESAKEACQFDEAGNLYIAGYEGRDLTVLTQNGEVIISIDQIFPYYWHPYYLTLSEQGMVLLSYEDYPYESISDIQIEINLKPILNGDHLYPGMIQPGDIASTGVSVSNACIDQDIDHLSMESVSEELFWKIMALYGNEAWKQNDGDIAAGNNAGYSLIDKKAVKEAASVLFSDFAGELPDANTEDVFYNEKSGKYAFRIGNFYGILSGIQTVTYYPDQSMDVEYEIKDTGENRMLGIYSVHFVLRAYAEGKNQTQNSDIRYSVESVKCISRGKTEEEKKQDALERYLTSMKTLEETSFGMTFHSTVTVTSDEENFTEILNMTGKNSEYEGGVRKTAGTFELYEEDSKSMEFTYYSDGHDVYINYQRPVSQKVKVEQLPVQSFIQLPELSDGSAVYSGDMGENYIDLTVDSSILDIDSIISQLVTSGVDYTCSNIFMYLFVDENERPSGLSIWFDITLAYGDESAVASFSEKMTFYDYGEVVVETPPDLDSYG